MRTFMMAIVISFLFSSISHASQLTIGLIPEQNVFKQFKRYQPLGAYIEKKTGIEIEFTILPRYGNIIESFESKQMDGAFWGSFTGALAIKKLGVEPIVRPVNLDGTSSYRGYILVHKDSRIRNVRRMKFTTIAFVDKATTAGYVFPLAYFREKGVKDISSYFKEYYFTGSHDAAIYAVLNKEAEVGCAKNTIFDMLVRAEPGIEENLVILEKSPDVPSNGLGLRKNIPSEIRLQLKKVFLDLHRNAEGKKVLEEFGVRKFIETTKGDYEPVFEIARKADIDLKTYDYMNE